MRFREVLLIVGLLLFAFGCENIAEKYNLPKDPISKQIYEVIDLGEQDILNDIGVMHTFITSDDNWLEHLEPYVSIDSPSKAHVTTDVKGYVVIDGKKAIVTSFDVSSLEQGPWSLVLTSNYSGFGGAERYNSTFNVKSWNGETGPLFPYKDHETANAHVTPFKPEFEWVLLKDSNILVRAKNVESTKYPLTILITNHELNVKEGFLDPTLNGWTIIADLKDHTPEYLQYQKSAILLSKAQTLTGSDIYAWTYYSEGRLPNSISTPYPFDWSKSLSDYPIYTPPAAKSLGVEKPFYRSLYLYLQDLKATKSN